jgi:hypothetical protein
LGTTVCVGAAGAATQQHNNTRKMTGMNDALKESLVVLLVLGTLGYAMVWYLIDEKNIERWAHSAVSHLQEL